jgi:hypothetical protein
MINFPHRALMVDLDSSWASTFVELTARGYRLGWDYVYTYGPLGYLASFVETDVLFWPRYVYEIFGKFLAAALLVDAVRRLPRLIGGFFLVWIFCFVGNFSETIPTILIFALGCHLVLGHWSGRKLVCAVVCLTFWSLIKHTYFLEAYAFLALAVVERFAEGKRREALGLAAMSIVLFALLWLMLGYRISALPYYWRCAVEISQGYQDTMFTPWKKNALYWALGLWICLGGITRQLCRLESQKKRRLRLVLLVLAGFFLAWKHAAIRSETHALGWFVYAPTAGVFLLSMFPTHSWSRTTSLWVTGLWIFGLLAVGTHMGKKWQGRMFSMSETIQAHAAQVLDPLGTRAHLGQSWTQATESFQEPGFSRKIGRGSVDFLGYEQGMILANGWNYRPRPVFQSFSAYTPYLAELNRKFYQRSSAPDWVILKMQSLEGRVPTLDDAGALECVLRTYRPVDLSGDYLLWKKSDRQSNQRGDVQKARMTVGADQTVEIPSTPNTLKISFEFKLPWWEQLQTFLMKPSEILLKVEMEDHSEQSYRLPPGEAREPFLIAPALFGNSELIHFFMREPMTKVKRISWSWAEHSKRHQGGEARVTFWESPQIFVDSQTASHSAEIHEEKLRFRRSLFPNFGTIPDEPQTTAGLRVFDEGGKKVVFLHAPSSLIWKYSGSVRQFSGFFGIMSGAYTGEVKTDGVQFEIVARSPHQTRVLLSRYLNPEKETGDRGLQSFQIPLPEGEWEIEAKTGIGPNGNGNCDWSYWSEVRFIP